MTPEDTRPFVAVVDPANDDVFAGLPSGLPPRRPPIPAMPEADRALRAATCRALGDCMTDSAGLLDRWQAREGFDPLGSDLWHALHAIGARLTAAADTLDPPAETEGGTVP